MSEAPKKPKLDPLNPFSLTNWTLRKVGTGVGKVAKVGYEMYKEKENERFEEVAVQDIHRVMFGGIMPTPGHPLPPIRTTPLSSDELKQFTDACNGLLKRGITLPKHVTSFAAHFYIRLKP